MVVEPQVGVSLLGIWEERGLAWHFCRPREGSLDSHVWQERYNCVIKPLQAVLLEALRRQ